MEQKRILITGASGFIGSTAVDKALQLGYETWAGIRAEQQDLSAGRAYKVYRSQLRGYGETERATPEFAGNMDGSTISCTMPE